MTLRRRIAKPKHQESEDQSSHISGPPQQLDLNTILNTGKRDPQTILQLQRTIGNRATQSLLQRQTNTIQRAFTLNDTDWKEARTLNATKPGTEGVTGVFFISNKAGEQLVIKPARRGARSVMATSIMKDVGVDTSGIRNIPFNSTEDKKLRKVVKKLINQKKATENALLQWGKLPTSDFDSFVVMEKVENLKTFQNIANGSGFEDIGEFSRMLDRMWSSAFWFDLGRVHAADMMMGNSDRLDHLNIKNIFVNSETGRAVGLDLALETSGFDTVTKQTPEGLPKSLEGNEYKDWVTYAIEGVEGKRMQLNRRGEVVEGSTGLRGGEVGPSDTRLLTDEGRIRTKIVALHDRVKAELEMGQTNDVQQRIQAWDNANWDEATTGFVNGMRQGMLVLNQKIESGAYDDEARRLKNEFGDDPNIETTVIKLRNMYYQQMQNDPDVVEAELRIQLETYAKWLHTGQGYNPFDRNKFVLDKRRRGRGAIPMGKTLNIN
ncbi:MAG: hypothetical protein ABI690_20440 [Chloroflexota bacterium]